MKKMKFLYICRIEDEQEIPLTYVNNINQAREYIYRYYLVKHLEHFKAWCECHDRPDKTWEDYIFYAHNVIEIHTNPDNLQIIPTWFNQEDIAAVLRVNTLNYPVGASYETPEEIQFFENLQKN